jgi:hypothetical protein
VLSGLLTWLVLWTLTVSWARELGMPIREVIQGLAGGTVPSRPAAPLSNIVGPQDVILSEDTLVEVGRHRTPVVLDAYAFAYIERKHPDWVARL